MKKLFLILVATMAMFAFTACGGGNSPKSVAEEAMSALKNKDYDKFVDCAHITVKEGEDPEAAKKTISGMLQSKAESAYAKKGGFKSYEILSETIDESGDKAVVKVKMVYGNGEEEEEDCKMIKDEKGNWKMDIGK